MSLFPLLHLPQDPEDSSRDDFVVQETDNRVHAFCHRVQGFEKGFLQHQGLLLPSRNQSKKHFLEVRSYLLIFV